MYDGMKPGNSGLSMGAGAGSSDDTLMRAMKLRDNGLPIEQIAEAVGMSVEELEMFFAQADASSM